MPLGKPHKTSVGPVRGRHYISTRQSFLTCLTEVGRETSPWPPAASPASLETRHQLAGPETRHGSSQSLAGVHTSGAGSRLGPREEGLFIKASSVVMDHGAGEKPSPLAKEHNVHVFPIPPHSAL